MKNCDVFVLGSFVVGITVCVPRWPTPGETLMGDHFDFSPGGKGTNQAVAASRQGATVKLMAALGKDLFAETAFSLYREEGIGREHLLQFDDERTGCGIVTVVNGENQIALYPGANMRLAPTHVDSAESSIASSTIVLAQLEVPIDTVLAAFHLGRKHGCLNILNPAPATLLPSEVFPLLDLITPNSTEARILLGLSPDDTSCPEDLARDLLLKGVGHVVMTLGPEGAMVADAAGLRRIASASIQAIDSTGAGDTFNGVLAACLARGLSLDDAVFRATRAGAHVTLSYGSIAGIPTESQLNQFIKTHA